MHVIIAGGTGLLGAALVKNLVQDGHKVTVLSRSPERKQQNVHERAAIAQWDARTAEGWGHLVEEADAIVNLAGAGIADSRWSEERKRLIRDSRVHAGQAIMAALRAAQNKPKVLVQASGVGYYGPSDDRVLTEDAPVGRDFLSQVCFDWEASTGGANALGMRRPIIRTGIVLSTQGGALPKMLLPFQLFIGGPLGSGRQYFPWIHIDDEIGAIRFLIENDRADGPYNLAAPNPPTNAEFSNDLGKAMGRPSLMPVPGFALKTLFGEMSTVLLDGQRAVPHRLEEEDFTFKYADAVPALRDVLENQK
jgi:uncharacterized protein